MPDDRWQRLKDVFGAALELPAASREAYLRQACGDDDGLRREVGALLEGQGAAGEFLSRSPGLEEEERPATPSLTGRRIGPYRVIRELGHGGMGVVYLAERADAAFEKSVAIKVVRGGLASGHALTQRFHEERRILATLEHPNIARLLDAGSLDDGLPYLVMEYVDGTRLDAHCEATHLSVPQRLGLFRQVCAAVQFAHQRLVIHRDLKAGNILVTAEGTPKLLDFGIAKLLEPGIAPEEQTRTGVRALTLEAASPEQVRGEPMTVSSDVYSLGALLYRLLAGQSPYGAAQRNDVELMQAICDQVPARPSAAGPIGRRRELLGDLDWIVLKALRKDPARRYPSVEQLSEDIQRHLARLPVLAAPDAWTYRARKFVARHWVGLGAAGAVALALLAGGVATRWQARRAERRFNDVRKLAKTFMFDVHDAIEKLPGSTAARKLLVTEALQYLDSLASEAGGDASLERELAAAYEKMADVQGRPNTPNLGDLEGAVATYGKAQAARERLLAADSANSEIRRDLSTTSLKLAHIMLYTGDPRAGWNEARKASSIEETLAATDKTPAQSFRLARSYTTHGYLLGADGRTVESLDRLRKAVALLEPLEKSGWKGEEVRLQLALAYGYLAEVLSNGAPVAGLVPDLKASLELYRKELALEQALARTDPLNIVFQRRVLVAFVHLGDVSSRLGDRAAAVENYRRSLAEAETLARGDPANLQAQADLVSACLSLGTQLARNGDAEQALRLLGRAEKLLAPFVARDPARLSTRVHVADHNIGLGYAHSALGSNPAVARETRLGHWREAKSRFQAAHAFYAEMRNRGSSTGEEAAQTDVLAREIAKCDAALGEAVARQSTVNRNGTGLRHSD